MDNKNEILIYEDKDGITKVNVTFTDEDIWLTQNQLVQNEGSRKVKRNVKCYNLDAFISVGYRVAKNKDSVG